MKKLFDIRRRRAERKRKTMLDRQHNENAFLMDAITDEEIAELQRVTTLDDILHGRVQPPPNLNDPPHNASAALEDEARQALKRGNS